MATVGGLTTGQLRRFDWELAWELVNPTDVTLEDYRRAARLSSVVRFLEWFVMGRVAERVGEYEHPDPRIEAWVRSNILPALTNALRSLLKAWYYGAVMANLEWDTRTGALRLQPVYVAQPEQWWHGQPRRDPETQDLIGWNLNHLRQVDFYNAQGIRQVIHWCPDRSEGDAWGVPAARAIYAHYYQLRRIYGSESIAAECAAIPRALFPHKEKAQGDKLVEAYAGLGPNGAMSLDEDLVDKVRWAPTIGSGNAPFADPIQNHIAGIAWCYGMPTLGFHSRKQGNSQAQAQTHASTGDEFQGDLTAMVIDEVFLAQVIGPALRLQWGPRAPLGSMATKPAVEPNLNDLADMVLKLRTADVYDPTNPDHLAAAGHWFALPMERRIADAQRDEELGSRGTANGLTADSRGGAESAERSAREAVAA